MRWFFVFTALICFSVVLFGSVVVSASDLETATVSVEADPVPDQSVSPEGEIPDSLDPGMPVASDDPVVYAAPTEADSFAGLAYYDVSTNLGDIRLYLPSGVSSDTFQLEGTSLINMSNSTVYLYCPEFPNYTFSASRFNSITYRTSNYDSSDLVVNDFVRYSAFDDIVPFVTVFCFALIVFFLIRGLF